VKFASSTQAIALPTGSSIGIRGSAQLGSDGPTAAVETQLDATCWDVPFVGRAAELRRLRAALEAACEGHGRVVLLVGPCGIGKTRLGDELAREAAVAGAETLVGRCYEGDGAPTFWLWTEVLRAYTEARDVTTLAAELGPGAIDIAAVVPDLCTRLSDLPALSYAPPEDARFRFLDAVCRVLVRAAAGRPLVLVLDDLHAADRASLLLLELLASRLRQTRILVVGALRDDALGAGQPFTRTVSELMRNGVLDRLDLRGLSEADVATLIERLAGTPPPPGLAATVVGRTEGIPLYVVEVVRELVASGSLRAEGTPTSIDIPPNVRIAVACRLETLSSAGRELLAEAAALGREFRVDVLLRTVDLGPARVRELLDEASRARIVSEVAGEPCRYRFAHALFVDALVDGSSAARRSSLERGAPEALPHEPRAENALTASATTMQCVIRCEGDYWLVAFDGQVDRFLDSVGLRYLAQLLWHPGRLVRAIDLAAAGLAATAQRRRDPDVTVRADLGDAGVVIDARARAEYKRRLDELAAEREDAERANDIGRTAVVQGEIDMLTEEIASAARSRKIASHAERARVSVTKGLSAAIVRLARRHPALGEHLRVTVKRGYSCSYTPDPRLPICWQG
jgi:hypothetical protein